MKINCSGKILIARYGKIFRGNKVKNKNTKKQNSLFFFSVKIKSYIVSWAFLVAETVKNLNAMQETWAQSQAQEDPLEKETATHSSVFAWGIPWTEVPGGLQPIGSQRVRLRD